MILVGSHLLCILCIAQGKRIHVERATIAFTQEIHRLAIGGNDRVTILTCTVGQISVLTRLHIILPDVSGDR